MSLAALCEEEVMNLGRRMTNFLSVVAALWGSAVCAQQAVVTLEDFATKEAVARWDRSGTETSRMEPQPLGGRPQLALKFAPYVKGGPEWPLIRLATLPVADWSGFSALLVDVTNPTTEQESMSVELRDTTGKNGWTQRFELPPRDTTTVRVSFDLADPKFNFKTMREIILFKTRPMAEVTLYVGPIRLVTQAFDALRASLDRVGTTIGVLSAGGGPARFAASAKRLADLEREASQPALTVAQVNALAVKTKALETEVEKMRYRAPFAFDFGPKDSPVRPGFRQVTPQDVFTPQAGFGWRVSKGLLSTA
jgi:hypothetical protein